LAGRAVACFGSLHLSWLQHEQGHKQIARSNIALVWQADISG
jgi:hypothetical protein